MPLSDDDSHPLWCCHSTKSNLICGRFVRHASYIDITMEKQERSAICCGQTENIPHQRPIMCKFTLYVVLVALFVIGFFFLLARLFYSHQWAWTYVFCFHLLLQIKFNKAFFRLLLFKKKEHLNSLSFHWITENKLRNWAWSGQQWRPLTRRKLNSKHFSHFTEFISQKKIETLMW